MIHMDVAGLSHDARDLYSSRKTQRPMTPIATGSRLQQLAALADTASTRGPGRACQGQLDQALLGYANKRIRYSVIDSGTYNAYHQQVS